MLGTSLRTFHFVRRLCRNPRRSGHDSPKSVLVEVFQETYWIIIDKLAIGLTFASKNYRFLFQILFDSEAFKTPKTNKIELQISVLWSFQVLSKIGCSADFLNIHSIIILFFTSPLMCVYSQCITYLLDTRDHVFGKLGDVTRVVENPRKQNNCHLVGSTSNIKMLKTFWWVPLSDVSQ